MTVRWANADAGRIFCINCEAALQTPMPLIQSAREDYSPSSRTVSPMKGTIAKGILRERAQPLTNVRQLTAKRRKCK